MARQVMPWVLAAVAAAVGFALVPDAVKDTLSTIGLFVVPVLLVVTTVVVVWWTRRALRRGR